MFRSTDYGMTEQSICAECTHKNPLTGSSEAGDVFSAADDLLVEHTRLAGAVCFSLALLLAATQLAAGTCADVLCIVEFGAIRQ